MRPLWINLFVSQHLPNGIKFRQNYAVKLNIIFFDVKYNYFYFINININIVLYLFIAIIRINMLYLLFSYVLFYRCFIL